MWMVWVSLVCLMLSFSWMDYKMVLRHNVYNRVSAAFQTYSVINESIVYMVYNLDRIFNFHVINTTNVSSFSKPFYKIFNEDNNSYCNMNLSCSYQFALICSTFCDLKFYNSWLCLFNIHFCYTGFIVNLPQ